MRARPTALAASALAAVLGLAACGGAESDDETPPAAQAPAGDAGAGPADAGDDDAAPVDGAGGPGASHPEEWEIDDTGGHVTPEGYTYSYRLVPVSRVLDVEHLRISGRDAWATVSTLSTDASSVLTCLQLMNAAVPGEETLTVIFGDGVEELCEWPEED